MPFACARRGGGGGYGLIGELGGEMLDFMCEAAVCCHKRFDAAMIDETITHLLPLPERCRETKEHLIPVRKKSKYEEQRGFCVGSLQPARHSATPLGRLVPRRSRHVCKTHRIGNHWLYTMMLILQILPISMAIADISWCAEDFRFHSFWS
jgi:hypothetical protein